MKECPDIWRIAFQNRKAKELTSAEVEELFTVDLSFQGSNKRMEEDQTMAYWGEFLVFLEGKHCLAIVHQYRVCQNSSLFAEHGTPR